MKFLSLLQSFSHSLMPLLLLCLALVDIWSPATKLPFHVVLRLKLLGKHSVCVCVSQVHHLPPRCKRMIKLESSVLASLSHLILFSLLALCRKCVWVRHPAESCCPASPLQGPVGVGRRGKAERAGERCCGCRCLAFVRSAGQGAVFCARLMWCVWCVAA